MKIENASIEELKVIEEITYRTIEEIYPHYYARGAVDFFLKHHNKKNIENDIKENTVFLLKEGEQNLGTVTIKGNEIARLFVLPEHQKNGYGTMLLDFAEKKIGEKYDEIVLDASLPAKLIYTKRGYHETESYSICTENGDYLCYDVMKKYCSRFAGLSYDNKIFVPQINSENGEVDGQTRFHYHQKDNLIWAEYEGGEVVKGFLIGTSDGEGKMNFTYQHRNIRNEARIGTCRSVPVILENGKIELHEEWQWLNGDMTKGNSIIVEE